MKTARLLLTCLIGIFLDGCNRANPVPSIPEKKSNFARQVFTEPVSDSTITLVSETECEINNRDQIVLAEYSRQENQLRLVLRLGGMASVMYYDISPDGLREPKTNRMFLLPEPLAKVRDQIRIAKEAQAAREKAVREEQQRLAQLEAERKQRLKDELHQKTLAMRDGGIDVVRRFFTRGATIAGVYNPRNTATSSFEVTLNGELSFEPMNGDPYDQKFAIPGHMKWCEGVKSQPFVGSSRDSKDRENDGMFMGEVVIRRNGDERSLRIQVAFCVRDLNFSDRPWSYTGAQSVWNGERFDELQGTWSTARRFYRNSSKGTGDTQVSEPTPSRPSQQAPAGAPETKAIAPQVAKAPASRMWIDTKGRRVEGSFQGLHGDSIDLQTKDGKIHRFPLSNLSAADQELARKLAKTQR